MTRRWRLVAVLGSVALIAAATLLPFGAAGARVPTSWCVRCSPVWGADAVANVLLFTPFGAALALSGATGRRALGAALLLSLLIETLQRIGLPPGRSASVLDLISNAVGGGVGWVGTSRAAPAARATGRAAQRWALTWAASACLMLWGSAWGTQGSGRGLGHVATSAIPYAPGYGWYGGSPIDATIGTTVLPHRGDGPIVAVAEGGGGAFTVRVRTAGRDRASYPRAIFFLHTEADSTPELAVLQHGRSVDVRVRRNAERLALYFPVTSLPEVLAETDRGDTVSIGVDVSSRSVQVVAAMGTPVVTRRTELRLTPLLGWSFVQRLVQPNGVPGVMITALWIALLAAPAGWWMGRTTGSGGEMATVVVGAGLLLCGLIGPHFTWGTALPTLPECGLVAMAGAAPLIVARRRRTASSRLHQV